MKRITIIILLALLAGTFAQAQQNRKWFDPKEFQTQLEAFITNEAGFTTEEAQAFYPIYNEMKEKQRKIQHRIFHVKKENKNMEDGKDYCAVIKELNCLNTRKARIQEDYYQKMTEAVPAQKVFKAMLAEDRFFRQALNKANKK